MNIVFTGNRQCNFVASAFRLITSQLSDFTVTYLSDDDDFPDSSLESIQAADVIVLQERCIIRNFDIYELNKTAKVYKLPEIIVDFLWPFGGQPHVLNLPGPQLPQGPFPTTLGDAYLNRRIQTHFTPELFHEYVTLRVDRIIDLDAYMESVLERQRSIDQVTGTCWASTIRYNYRQRPILLNPLYPTAWVLTEILSNLLNEMNFGIILVDAKIAQICALVPELPIHPSVSRHFGLYWVREGQRYRLRDSDRVPFTEYVRRYLAYAEGQELEIGVRALSAQSYDSALKNLRLAVQRPLGRNSVTAQRALAHALVENGSSEEARDVIRIVESINPDDTEVLLVNAKIFSKFGRIIEAEKEIREYTEKGGSHADAYIALADIYTQNGKLREAAEALRLALTVAHPDPGLQSRLSLTLAASGELNAARESVEVEIMLAPDNPHPRVFLAGLLMRLGEREASKAQVENMLTTIKYRQELEGLRESLRSLYRSLDPPFRDDLL